MSDEPWRREIVDLLSRRQKIEAIRRYREVTGAGLAEAARFVDTLGRTLKTGELPTSTTDLTPELEQILVEQLRSGQFIQAIKHYREATGSDLYHSKQAVEALAQRNGIPIAGPMPFAPWVVIAALILGGIIAAVCFIR